MTALTVESIKEFMHLLFKSGEFNNYLVHKASATTFTSFEISGDLNPDFFDDENRPERRYCTWEEVRPFMFSVIKGSKLPKNMKIVLAAPDDLTKSLTKNASVLFINIIYENGTLSIITGSSVKNFSLDKSHEFIWDEYVCDLFKKTGILITQNI